MDLKRKVATGIATGALLANVLAPIAFADTELTISGNGANSDNDIKIELENEVNIDQDNYANFDNNIDADANTGDNDANKNTGGDVEIKTGDAEVDITLDNSANINWVDVDCGCTTGDLEVKIEGNGTDSDNNVEVKQDDDDNKIDITQNNRADFDNYIKYVTAKTGNNDANKNTGGDVEIDTGDASVTVEVSNWANANSARVGNGDKGSISLMILDNGFNTDNDIKVELENEVKIDQDNDAYIDNDVDADAKTGDNDANKNTGGDVEITTGDAEVDITIDNMANFNWADLNCGCMMGDDLTVKVKGNGTDSINTVDVELESDQDVDQDNRADFDNDVKGSDAKTGNNDANKNTGESGSDPSIDTGDADVVVDVSNEANMNGVGGDEPEWPSFGFGGLSISLSLDLGSLLDSLGL